MLIQPWNPPVTPCEQTTYNWHNQITICISDYHLFCQYLHYTLYKYNPTLVLVHVTVTAERDIISWSTVNYPPPPSSRQLLIPFPKSGTDMVLGLCSTMYQHKGWSSCPHATLAQFIQSDNVEDRSQKVPFSIPCTQWSPLLVATLYTCYRGHPLKHV